MSLVENIHNNQRVLMFGWEFPPLMAGGLGVACQALVQSLVRRNVNINLVLPKVTGEEESHNFTIYATNTWHEIIEAEIQEYNVQNIINEVAQNIYINPTCPSYTSANTNKSPIHIDLLSKTILTKLTKELKRNRKQLPTAKISNPAPTVKNLQVYGSNLMHEIYQYNNAVGSIANYLEYDVIHCHDWLTIGAGIIAKQQSNKPLIVQIHCTEYDRCPGYGNDDIHKLEQLGCQYADKVIAVSNRTKQILIDKYHINPHKIEVVHNGIELSPENIPATQPLRKKRPKILFLGRVTYQKGPNYFLEAAVQVLKHRPDAEFIMAGTGDMLDYLKVRASELGIQDNIQFLGAIPSTQVSEIYRDVDCFIMSSVSEPFGLTVLEALSQRLPVIVSKQAGVSEVLRHILKYDFWDIDRLTDLILSVINYEPLSQVLKEYSIHELEDISWNVAAEKVNHIYNMS